MKYQNPVLPGMYPDPSVCEKDGTYYLVNSSFEYFPAIPIFESKDLVNWKQIGNCITDPDSVSLAECPSSGGIFAVTIRYHEGKFYIITTAFGKTGLKNFFMTAEDPAGEWSAPTFLEVEGIDPSLYWEDGKTYVQYTGRGKIMQAVIDESTGDILEGPELISLGTGGRDAEGPHIYKRDGWYYLMLAEGGTREGHYVTMQRSRSIWGPYENSPYDPVVSNKDYAKEPIQCVGHADWITDSLGNDYIVCLGNRQIKHKPLLGRETMLTEAYWTEDGWLRAGNKEDDDLSASARLAQCGETKFEGSQELTTDFVWDMDHDEVPMCVISPRRRHDELAMIRDQKLYVTGNRHTLCSTADPVLFALRQRDYKFSLKTAVSWDSSEITPEDEAGLAMFMDETHHFSIFATVRDGKHVVVFRKQVDDLCMETCVDAAETAELEVVGEPEKYHFLVNGKEIGWTYNKHLSTTCVNSPNTGAIGGIYVASEKTAVFSYFEYHSLEENNGIS